MTFQKVATTEQLWSGEKLGVTAGDKKLLLVNVDGTVYAYDDCCCHKGVALSSGKLKDNVLTCSAHHWQYDVCTGKGVNPQQAQLKAHEVKIEDGYILVEVDGAE